MERCPNIAMKQRAQPCPVVHAMNIYGPMANTIKSQRHFRHQNTLNSSWIGPRVRSIMKLSSRFQQTYHSRNHFPACVGKYWQGYSVYLYTSIYITLTALSVSARWVFASMGCISLHSGRSTRTLFMSLVFDCRKRTLIHAISIFTIS